MKATELHARLGGTLHTLSTASWALHVSRWRPSTPARFDAEWESHPAERREVVVFNRRCYENRYSRAFGDHSYAYAGQVAQATPIAPETVVSPRRNTVPNPVFVRLPRPEISPENPVTSS